MKKLSLLTTFAVFVMLLTFACKKEVTPPVPGTNEVWMQNNAFNPSTITVAVNTTITWTNKDATDHTVTSDSASLFKSGTMIEGATYTHQFTTKGTYSYHCGFHTGMNGKVVVQ